MVVTRFLVWLAFLGVGLQLQILNQRLAVRRDPEARLPQPVQQRRLDRCDAIPHRGVSRGGHVADVVALQDVDVASAAVAAGVLAGGVGIAEDPRIWKPSADLLAHRVGVMRSGHHAEHPQLATAPNGQDGIAVADVEIHASQDRLVRMREARGALVGSAEPVEQRRQRPDVVLAVEAVVDLTGCQVDIFAIHVGLKHRPGIVLLQVFDIIIWHVRVVYRAHLDFTLILFCGSFFCPKSLVMPRKTLRSRKTDNLANLANPDTAENLFIG